MSSWIAIRTNLSTDPAILAIAKQCGITRQHVVGALHAIWSWADTHTADGVVHGVQAAFVDELASVEGFANAMIHVGWLIADDDGIRIPNFDRFMSQSAKRRQLTSRRVAQHRLRKRNSGGVTDSLPQNRTEHNSTEQHSSMHAADAGASQQNHGSIVEQLRAAGVDGRLAGELATLPSMSADLVNAAAELVAKRRNVDNPAGLVVTLLRNPPDDLRAAAAARQRNRDQNAQRQAEAEQHQQNRQTIANIPQAEWPRIAESAADWLRAHGRDADADELQRWGQRPEKLPPAAIAALAAAAKTE